LSHAVVRERSGTVEGAEHGDPHRRIAVASSCFDRLDVAGVSGDHHLAQTVGGHRWSKPDIQITAQAMANAITIADSTPVRMPIPPLAASARIRRIGPGRL